MSVAEIRWWLDQAVYRLHNCYQVANFEVTVPMQEASLASTTIAEQMKEAYGSPIAGAHELYSAADAGMLAVKDYVTGQYNRLPAAVEELTEAWNCTLQAVGEEAGPLDDARHHIMMANDGFLKMQGALLVIIGNVEQAQMGPAPLVEERMRHVSDQLAQASAEGIQAGAYCTAAKTSIKTYLGGPL